MYKRIRSHFVPVKTKEKNVVNVVAAVLTACDDAQWVYFSPWPVLTFCIRFTLLCYVVFYLKYNFISFQHCKQSNGCMPALCMYSGAFFWWIKFHMFYVADQLQWTFKFHGRDRNQHAEQISGISET